MTRRFCFMLLALAQCTLPALVEDASVPQDAALVDAGEGGGAPDAALGCVSASAGFPRALGLPEPEPNGVFDPDLVRDPETGRLYVSYSAVNGAPGTGQVSTHLGYSDDEGATWCYVGVINASTRVELASLPPGVSGTRAHWSHETSALVHDPGAPAEARWRLLWHRYLHVDEPGRMDGRRFEYGWIAERVAATPEGLVSAPEVKLFGALGYYLNTSITAYNEAAPGGTPRQRLDALAGLEGCVVATEPALLAHEGALHLALFCAASETQNQIALLRLDRASGSWAPVGTLVTQDDGPLVDPSYDGFNAADLFTYEGGFGLLLSPTTANRYRGCIAFGVDLDTAALGERGLVFPLGDSASAPFGGACTFLEGSALGLITAEIRTTGTTFTVNATGITDLGAGP